LLYGLIVNCLRWRLGLKLHVFDKNNPAANYDAVVPASKLFVLMQELLNFRTVFDDLSAATSANATRIRCSARL